MIKLSELLSKPLISLSEAKTVGILSNVIFDDKLKKGKFVEVLCDDENDAERKFVDVKKLSGEDGDVVMIASTAQVTNVWDTAFTRNNPINKTAVTVSGVLRGTVTDVVLDGATVIEVLLSDGTSFPPDKVVSYSDETVIFNDTDKPVKKFRIKLPAPTAAPPKPVRLAAPIIKPDRIPADGAEPPNTYGFLMGKRINRPLAAPDGTPIALEGEVVTAEIIDAAKKVGKLVQLALHTV